MFGLMVQTRAQKLAAQHELGGAEGTAILPDAAATEEEEVQTGKELVLVDLPS